MRSISFHSLLTALVLAPVLASALGLLFAPATVAAKEGPMWRPDLLPVNEETAYALEACPHIVQSQAGVYVLTQDGFQMVRESTNGFHALVGRSQPGAFEPQCFDPHGSATLLRRALLRGELQMTADSSEDVEQGLAAAWASGELQPATQAGVNHMLSDRNCVPVGPGQVRPYPPHVMFYAPYAEDTDVGGDKRGGSPIFVINEGSPAAYVIVPVPIPQGQEPWKPSNCSS